MRRLILLTLEFPPMKGGVARYLEQMAAYFGERMKVIAPPEYQLLSRWFWPRWLPALLVLQRVSRRGDTVVVSHILPLGLVALLARWLAGRRYMVILHGMDFALSRRNAWKRVLTKWILKGAELIVVNSHALGQEVSEFVKVRELVVVYPCLSEEIVAHGNREPSSAGATAGGQGTGNRDQDKSMILLTVARLVPRKGHGAVLEALALMRDQGFREPLCYYIVGDGPQYRELLELVKSLKLQDRVVFVRQASDEQLIDYYRRADIFIMVTENLGADIEGFGTVYIEAAAFGVPAIASDLPGVNEAVLSEQTGLLVPPNSITDLVVAIQRLVSDGQLRSRLGSNARSRALREFSCYQQFANLEAYL